ncbi:MAG TPA: phosphatase PAP2 family protein [Spongiibacteraceae bacterium]|nr:phosphatase PAP2 family protein [Spongiibacteraceae bacterium]
MNFFDKSILLFLNGFVGRWPHLDLILVQFQQNDLLKGAIFIALFWYLWFSPAVDANANLQRRQKLFGAICAVVVGILVARSMADLLPFRLRPLANPDLHLSMPGDVPPTLLATWSAFPSDHAVVWFALAVAICLVHRTLGALTFGYACFLGIGRVYMGVHHPTDIIVGGGIGAGLTVLFCNSRLNARLYAAVENVRQAQPGWFYAGLFLATYEIANLFDEVRLLATMAWRMTKMLAH